MPPSPWHTYIYCFNEIKLYILIDSFLSNLKIYDGPICKCIHIRQEEKGTAEDEMAGWHHRQGGLACCDSWGHKESDTIEQLIWSDLIWRRSYRGHDCLFTLKLHSGKGCSFPPLPLECTFCPPLPQCKPLSRVQPWESNVLLSLTESS